MANRYVRDIGVDPEDKELDPLAAHQSLESFMKDIGKIRAEWDSYKASDHPIHLLRVIGDLDHVASVHNIDRGSLYRKVGGDIAAFGTQAAFRIFCLTEAARHARKHPVTSDEYLRTGYIFQRLGLQLDEKKEVSFHPIFGDRLPLLGAFARAVNRPVVHFASNWTGKDFDGFKSPVVTLG